MALRDSFAELRFDITFGSVVTLSAGQLQRYQWYLDAEEAREAAGVVEPRN